MDAYWMLQALKLARRGLGRVSPNPMVGCVLVKKGKKIGEGYHSFFGGPHAEVAALKNAGTAARGSTAYVNLEPCNHWGKTPPCTQSLIRSGIRRAVIAMRDPNPIAKGGIPTLLSSGIQVRTGILELEARQLNRPYLTNILQKRPYVILKAASSLDGKISTASGKSKWITSAKARAAGHKWRSEVDAILVGINTIIKDDPSLTSHGQGRDPIRVILDTHFKISSHAKVLKNTGTTVIATALKLAPPRFRKEEVHVLHVPRKNGELDLRQVLKELARMGIGTLLVEGGASVHTSFLQEDLADEARIFLAPKLIGGEKTKTFFEGSGAQQLDKALHLKNMEVKTIGPDILVCGHLN
ncbi:MAG: bifunctional diaminohydroxyphosphoribosylaminopyrimidine deaminase/5-amino-6-(5-phosphoribosylamino)uracil reductase RibD [Elusimicrobia bacterium]|nr:bifunctional diaminohydroxyphosphoribosylaminopyrimidine deaminase/5-amino-6-(5-phosphoribosylamino)uracil reductase RibD [Elusimicrobiota bacterium]